MREEILYIDDGELVYYINENEFITCDEIPRPMLEGIKHLQQKVEQLENIRKEAVEELSYMSTDVYVEDYDIREKHYNLLMSILNKGDNNGK